MYRTINLFVLFIAGILLLGEQDTAVTNSGSEQEEVVIESGTQKLTDERYGYQFVVPSTFDVVDNRNNGAFHVVKLEDHTNSNIGIYWVIQNLDDPKETLLDWVEEQEESLMGELVYTRTTQLDKVSGIERTYLADDTYYFAQYYIKNGKVYLLNFGPLFSPEIPDNVSELITSFSWLDGEYSARVPTQDLPVEETSRTYSSGQPALQFPFCGTWKITKGYYNQTPGHDNNISNKYALDWINTITGQTENARVYAAHDGTVSVNWDSSGGGNMLKLTYTGDTSYQTWYLHLNDYVVESGSVTTGQPIAEVGNTGCDVKGCGDHLHFTLVHNGTSTLPEPMSGKTGFAPNQTHTRNCDSCCGCPTSASSSSSGGITRVEKSDLPRLPFLVDTADSSTWMPDDETGLLEMDPPELDEAIIPFDLMEYEEDEIVEIIEPPVEQLVGPPPKIAFANNEQPSSTSFKISNSLVGMGGGESASGSYRLRSAIGQAHAPVVAESSSYRLHSGFIPAALPASTHQIPLVAGWNLISSYMSPINPALPAMFADQPDLVLLKDNDGNVYWPDMAIDDIGNWQIEQGYQAYMEQAALLQVTGTQVDPAATPIELVQGWNTVSYLLDYPQPVPDAVSPIVNDLLILKNGFGEVYWPQYSVNSIGDMIPGQGYQVHMHQAEPFTYSQPSGAAAASSN